MLKVDNLIFTCPECDILMDFNSSDKQGYVAIYNCPVCKNGLKILSIGNGVKNETDLISPKKGSEEKK